MQITTSRRGLDIQINPPPRRPPRNTRERKLSGRRGAIILLGILQGLDDLREFRDIGLDAYGMDRDKLDGTPFSGAEKTEALLTRLMNDMADDGNLDEFDTDTLLRGVATWVIWEMIGALLGKATTKLAETAGSPMDVFANIWQPR